jgi:enoyl-CoA hydratase/carnithine racemase
MTQNSACDQRVSIELDEHGIAHVRMERPDKYNALDSAMFDALIAAGHKLAAMPGLRCVVLSGAGRSFCAGLDLSMFDRLLAADAPPLAERSHGNCNTFQQVAMQWRALAVPVIAAVQGICFGGGLQLAAGADVRVVAPDARMAVMEMKWGIIPDMGGFVLWRGLVRDDVLRELTYTAREFSGEEAMAMGFATHVDADPLARAMAIARDIADTHPQAIRSAKRLFNETPLMSVDDILMAESREQDLLIGSPNQLEAVQSVMEKRKPQFTDPE